MLVFEYDSKNMIDIIDSNNNVIGYFFFNERVADWSVNIDEPLYRDTARGIFNEIADKLDKLNANKADEVVK